MTCDRCGRSVNALGGGRCIDCAEAFDRFREDAEEFIRSAAAADTHSSDVDPGRVDPWEDR